MKKNKIKPEDFYGSESYPDPESKEQVWNNISRRLPDERPFGLNFELKSFSVGFASAVILFFFSLGVYFAFSSLIRGNQPEAVIISETYSRAVDNFEKALPVVVEKKENESIVDEMIMVKKEELDTLSSAIVNLKSELKTENRSDVKYQRLISLYRLKLKIIDSILELEGKRK